MIGYRLQLGVPAGRADELISLAERSWSAWLVFKRLSPRGDDARSSSGIQQLAPGKVCVSTHAPDGARRWRLLETSTAGRYVSTLTVAPVPGPAQAVAGVGGWLELTIEATPADGEDAAPVRPPRLASYLLQAPMPWRDAGGIELLTVNEVDRHSVPALVQALTDDRRRLPAIVMSAPNSGSSEWDQACAEISNATRGHASLWRLAPSAVSLLKERLGSELAVWGGAARTYLPGVQQGDEDDVYLSRHRVLGWAALRDRPTRFAAMLGRFCGDHVALASPWTAAPAALDQVQVDVSLAARLLLAPARAASRRAEPAPAAAGDHAGSAPSAGAGEGTSAETLTQVPGDAAPVPEAVQAEMARIQSDVDAALALAGAYEKDKNQAQREARAVADDNVETVRQLAAAEATIRNLRLALAAAQRPEAVDEVPVDLATELPQPDSFEDLLLLLEDVPGVHYTAAAAGTVPKPVRWLDRQTNRRACLAKTWDIVLAMAQYSSARSSGSFDGSFLQWCGGDAPPGARTLPVGPSKTLVPGESETVRRTPAMAAERLLPVPPEVNPTGYVHMWTHCRLGGGGDAPRLHFADCGGQIYIGYLGPHLSNTLTN